MNVSSFDNFANILSDSSATCYHYCLNISRVVFNFNEERNYDHLILVHLLNLADMRLPVHVCSAQNREELACSYFFISKLG